MRQFWVLYTLWKRHWNLEKIWSKYSHTSTFHKYWRLLVKYWQEWFEMLSAESYRATIGTFFSSLCHQICRQKKKFWRHFILSSLQIKRRFSYWRFLFVIFLCLSFTLFALWISAFWLFYVELDFLVAYLECVKLRASRTYMPYFLTCFTCLRAFASYVPSFFTHFTCH